MAQRTTTARWAHFVLLWLGVALVIDVSFWRHQSASGRVVIALITALAVWGIAVTTDAGHLARLRLEDPLLALAAASASLTLLRVAHLSPVLSATLVGVVGALAVRRVRGAQDYHGAPIYAGAFVGITSPLVLPHVAWLLVASVGAGALWSISREAWVGIGGKMGSMSLLAVVATSSLAHLVHQRGPGASALATHSLVGAMVVIGAVAAPLTYWLAHRRHWGAVLGSAAPTAAWSLVVALSHSYLHDHGDVLTYVWFGASFVGMTAPTRWRSPRVAIPIAGVVFSLLVVRFGPYLAGMGGTAGITALVAVFAVRGVESAVARRKVPPAT